jgi:NAD(P)-dependent dehydrogenase (short-subunit alcohol dehydrogenase family)
MVNDVRSKRRIVIIGAESAIGQGLCEACAGGADEVVAIEMAEERPEEIAAACGEGAIDLLIFADDMDVDGLLSSAGRGEMGDLLHRLVYAPFRLASLLRPGVTAAGGCVVLCSRTTSLMERVPVGGHFVDRPFRAAAHALWKCLAVEWRDDDIRLLIVALSDPRDIGTIMSLAGRDAGPRGLLVDGSGAPLSW